MPTPHPPMRVGEEMERAGSMLMTRVDRPTRVKALIYTRRNAIDDADFEYLADVLGLADIVAERRVP